MENFNLIFVSQLEQHYPLFIQMAETAHEMIMLLDNERKLVYFNKRFEEFACGHHLPAELGIRPGDAFKCVNAMMGDAVCGQTSLCRYCGASKAIETAYISSDDRAVEECRIVSEDGNAYDLKVSTNSINMFGAEYILYCVQDVSAEIRKASLEKIFFHDINNIVGGLSLIVDTLQMYFHEHDFDMAAELIPLLTSSTTSLNNEIKSNLILTLAEKDELVVNCRDVNIRRMLTETAEFFRNTVNKQIEFITNMDGECTNFNTDENLVKRILTNMVKNAAEASDDGDIVYIGCRLDCNKLIFFVKNPAVMSDEAKGSIFKRSFTTKGFGRGLGTYSMRLLTERYLKGKVWFTSDKGTGTIFYAEIPSSAS